MCYCGYLTDCGINDTSCSSSRKTWFGLEVEPSWSPPTWITFLERFVASPPDHLQAPVAVEEQWGYSKGLSDVCASSPIMKNVTQRKEHIIMEVDRFSQTTDNMLTTCNRLTKQWFATWERQLQQIWQRGRRFWKIELCVWIRSVRCSWQSSGSHKNRD